MATEKKAFVLRIQAETLKELERWAQEEFRSVNGQIEFLLNDALRKRKKRNREPGDNEAASDPTIPNPEGVG
ncbi:type II toxin-antitoxin system antitoxin [Spirosoma arcticum]